MRPVIMAATAHWRGEENPHISRAQRSASSTIALRSLSRLVVEVVHSRLVLLLLLRHAMELTCLMCEDLNFNQPQSLRNRNGDGSE